MESDSYLNNRTRFADYFVICGLDLSSGLESDSFEGDTLHSPPLERSYKSKVLGHYPENVLWNPFDKDAVGMLCLPNGLQFRTQKSNLEPKFHSFVITKQDGKRCYGASYIFYEETRNKKICSAMHTLQTMHLAELSGGHLKKSMDHNTRSLPRHFKFAHSRSAPSLYDHTKDTLYVSKSVALIMQQPYVYAPHIFLSGLFRCWQDQGTPSLESSVYNLLYEVCVPPPGRSLSFMCYPQEKVILQTPTSLDELPLFDFPLRELFTLLGVDCVIQLFTCLLLENQILLCSGEYQRLMLVAESLTALLLPFSWPHVYVPILPSSCQHFLDAPVPFVMGLHMKEGHKNLYSEANLCYMNLDTRLLQTPEDLPTFPHKHEFMTEICDVLRRHKVSGENLYMNFNHPNMNLMTSSCISTRTRKHSWADDLDDDPSLIQGSDTLRRIVSLTKRSNETLDVFDDDWDSMVDDGFSEETEISSEAQYSRDLRINNAVREIFLNRFVQMFSTYEHFIIMPTQDKEEWLNNRDSMQNFDKATFLSDQPQQHLPFLSRFIETQMFATLVDNKILSNWGPLDPSLRVFESKIKLLRNRYGDSLVRSPSYEPCSTICDSQLLLEKRLSNIDTEIPLPKELLPNHSVRTNRAGFPLLDNVILNQEPLQRRSGRLIKNGSRMANSFSSLSFDGLDVEGTNSIRRTASEARPLIGENKLTTLPTRSEASPKFIALTNWEFIEILLKECKQRTKRMLVEKLGSEAIEMGHCAQTSIVEENTLIASLCDLLDRVWSNGLQRKQGKSALWAHLMNYLEMKDNEESSNSINFQHVFKPEPVKVGFHEKFLSSLKSTNIREIASVIAYNLDLSSSSIDSSPDSRSSPRSRSESRTSNSRRSSIDYQQEVVNNPPKNTLVYDLRNIQAMTDIKTHVGYARAFVRLSLEKKMLSRHLRTLLSETSLLRAMYKRTAFLRCEEEKEQFLYHLLTLNAVEYTCFTNTYLNTRIPYRVYVHPSKKSNFSSTTANCWIQVYGTNAETQKIELEKGTVEMVFCHKNLGYLTTLRIGHDNAGLSPKVLIESLIVRNEVTGHTYNFPCGRWLGKGIDDDSTERLLVGEREKDRDIDKSRSGSRVRSPSVPPPKKTLPLSEIENLLGECINNLVKHFYRPLGKETSSSLTMLLCGENGLVNCLEQAFLHGFKSSRLFGRNLYIWDYLVKVKEELEGLSQIDDVIRYYCNLVDAIVNSGHNLGKYGKFQIFACLSVRDHMLQHIILSVLATSRTTLEMFEECSFFRDKNLLLYLAHILKSLDDFDIELENSLTYGITY